jgi:hypothetical protein
VIEAVDAKLNAHVVHVISEQRNLIRHLAAEAGVGILDYEQRLPYYGVRSRAVERRFLVGIRIATAISLHKHGDIDAALPIVWCSYWIGGSASD